MLNQKRTKLQILYGRAVAKADRSGRPGAQPQVESSSYPIIDPPGYGTLGGSLGPNIDDGIDWSAAAVLPIIDEKGTEASFGSLFV